MKALRALIYNEGQLRTTRIWTGVLTFIALALLVVNISVAQAHWWTSAWSYYHWHKSTLGVWIYGTFQNDSEIARSDWDRLTDLSLPRTNSHTDISLYAANFGNTGWGGLASLEDLDWQWHCWYWCDIDHAHARFNSFYGSPGHWAHGVQCQELAHAFGMGHHNVNSDCMGLSYFSPCFGGFAQHSCYHPGAHTIAEFNAQY